MGLYGRDWIDLNETLLSVARRMGAAQKQAEDEALSAAIRIVDLWAETIIRRHLGKIGSEIRVRALFIAAQREGGGQRYMCFNDMSPAGSNESILAVCKAIEHRLRFWSDQSGRFYTSSR